MSMKCPGTIPDASMVFAPVWPEPCAFEEAAAHASTRNPIADWQRFCRFDVLYVTWRFSVAELPAILLASNQRERHGADNRPALSKPFLADARDIETDGPPEAEAVKA
jgi:hypothetical protein